MAFALHPQLAADTRPVISLALNDVLLMNDARYLWCILVPRVPDLRDLHQVPVTQKARLHIEIDLVSRVVSDMGDAYKMNVAALGNVVEQLHIHIVARQRDDAAWPRPVWGVGDARPYGETRMEDLVRRLRARLQT